MKIKPNSIYQNIDTYCKFINKNIIEICTLIWYHDSAKETKIHFKNNINNYIDNFKNEKVIINKDSDYCLIKGDDIWVIVFRFNYQKEIDSIVKINRNRNIKIKSNIIWFAV